MNVHTPSPPSSNTQHTRHGVIASSAYQNLPTYGSHVLQRFTKETFGSFPFSSLRIGREQHVPDSPNHSLCLIKLFNFSNLDGNHLPEGSLCLSNSPYPPPPPPRQQQQQQQRAAQHQHNTTSDTTHGDRHRERDRERRQGNKK